MVTVANQGIPARHSPTALPYLASMGRPSNLAEAPSSLPHESLSTAIDRWRDDARGAPKPGLSTHANPSPGAIVAFTQLFGAPASDSSRCSERGWAASTCWSHGSGRGSIPELNGHLIYVVQAGSGSFLLHRNGVRMAGRVRRGTVLILPQGGPVDIDFSGHVECSQVFIPDAMFAAAVREAGLVGTPTLLERFDSADPVLYQLMTWLSATVAEGTADSKFLEQCALLLCTQLARKHSSASMSHVRNEPTGLASWQQQRVQEYMVAHLHAPVSLSDIASVVGLSRHYLCTAFRHATGFTPYEYLTLIRVEKAKELLANSRASVTDIASAVGYGTASAFTARFRRATGMTPRAFRSRGPNGHVSRPALAA